MTFQDAKSLQPDGNAEFVLYSGKPWSDERLAELKEALEEITSKPHVYSTVAVIGTGNLNTDSLLSRMRKVSYFVAGVGVGLSLALTVFIILIWWMG